MVKGANRLLGWSSSVFKLMLVFWVLFSPQVRADDAADCLDGLQQQLDASLSAAAEAVANLIRGDREGASEKLDDALMLAKSLADDASGEAPTTQLGKSAKAIQKAAGRLVVALESAVATADDQTKKGKLAISAVLRAVSGGMLIKKTMLQVETAGPLVVVMGMAKVQKKSGGSMPFKVVVVGGAEAKAEASNIGGSTGMILEGGVSWNGASAFSVTMGRDGGAARVVVSAGGRSSSGFVFNLGSFLPDARPSAPLSEKLLSFIPLASNPAEWTIVSGVHDSTQGREGGAPINASSEVAQLVMAADGTGVVKLMGVHLPGLKSIPLGPESTALAMVFSTPLLAEVCRQDAKAAEELLKSLPEYTALVDWISGNYGGADYLVDAMTARMKWELVAAVLAKLPAAPPPEEGGRGLMVDGGADRSGLEVEGVWSHRGGTNGLGVRNSRTRWVEAFFDGTEPVDERGLDSELIPGSKYSLTLSGFKVYDATSGILKMPTTYTGGLVRVYGPGFKVSEMEAMIGGEEDRTVLPWVMTLVDTQVLPAMEAITGVKGLNKALTGSKKMETFLRGVVEQVKGSVPSEAEGVVKLSSEVWVLVCRGLLEKEGLLLREILYEVGVSIGVEAGLTLSRYAGGWLGQGWSADELGVGGSEIVSGQLWLPYNRPKEVFAITDKNEAPVIVSGPTANPSSANTGQSVSFGVSASDGDGDSLSYGWDFGDGTTGTGTSPTHTFSTAGTYSVTVTVSDGRGGTDNGTVSLTVGGGGGGTVVTPTFSPAAGTYGSAQTVTISCSTSGATIYYTTDGATPTTSSATYASAITVSTSTTLKALAVKSGMTDSKVASGTYIIGEIAIDCGGGVSMQLVLLPAGMFTMGSPDSESDRYSAEGPQHQVTISKSFYMGKFEVTQAQYQAVMGGNPSHFTGDLQRPVEDVSWNDAQSFCQKLSTSSGRTVRLPTEAEWEYACRAGTSTRFYSGDADSALDGVGWYSSNSSSTTHVVGQKTANAWGLYDMHGNVFEWCQDWYSSSYYTANAVTDPQGPGSGDYRVLRGGSWFGAARFCRSAYRIGGSPYGSIGFRVVVLRTQ